MAVAPLPKEKVVWLTGTGCFPRSCRAAPPIANLDIAPRPLMFGSARPMQIAWKKGLSAAKQAAVFFHEILPPGHET